MNYKDYIVYQIYPQSFMDSNNDGFGDIPGITSKLDYLKYLGINAIWICPMYKSPNHDNGYDVSDYFSFQSIYGTNKDFEILLKEAHKRNIKVIIDLVLNHTSIEHNWFKKSSSSKTNEKADWYIWKDPKEDGGCPNNWGAMFGGPAWSYCKERNQYFFHTFSNFQPDLNWESESLKKELYKIIDYWVNKGVDGFRLDAINFISKDPTWKDGKIIPPMKYANIYDFAANGPNVHKFLQELKTKALDKYDIFTVGEASNSTLDDAFAFSKDIGLIFQFEHLCLDNSDFPYGRKKIDLIELKSVFQKWQNGMFGKCWNTLLWENHDQPRVVNRFQIDENNRENAAKMLCACLYLMQGTPFVYQGQELGTNNILFDDVSELRDIEAINLYKDFVASGKLSKEEMLERINNKSRATSRGPMLWSSEDNAGFTKNIPWMKVNKCYKTINVQEQIEREDSCLNFYRKIFDIRKKYNVVKDGNFLIKNFKNQNVFEYVRDDGKHKLIVICNFSKNKVCYDMNKYKSLQVLANNKKRISHDILSSYQVIVFYK